MAEWINIVTAIVSVGALGVALWSAFISRGARDAAKRSADAAEKAVQTAEQSLLENVRVRKINQFDILSPHFTNVDHLLKAFNGWEVTNGVKLGASANSIQHLSDALHQDIDFQKALHSLTKTLESPILKGVIRNYGEDTKVSLAQQAPGNLADIMNIFVRKKKEYLGI